MSIEKDLEKRSGNVCELCSATDGLDKYAVAPKTGSILSDCAFICNTCKTQIEDESTIDINHWRCLNDSMWNENPAVQVLAFRMLHQIKAEGWPQDLLDMMYMDDETSEWAKLGLGTGLKHIDANGVVLNSGDSVVLIQDLKVKGSSMVAKRGTAVRRIRLDANNAEFIEGKVDGQNIVIITKYVKKTK